MTPSGIEPAILCHVMIHLQAAQKN
jgi:hypothetical protein